MKKNNLYIGAALIVTLALIVFFYTNQDLPERNNSLPQENISSQTGDKGNPLSPQALNETIFIGEEKKKEILESSVEAKKSMGNIIPRYRTEENEDIQKKCIKILGDTVLGRAMASWIAYGTIMSGEADYGYELNLKMTLINEDPQAAMNLLSSSYNRFTEDDAFIKQMMLNIVNQVNVPEEERLKFYNEEATKQLKLKDDSTLTNDDMNITIAMYMVKENIKSENEALPFANTLLEKNKNNPIALKLIRERLDGNFPQIREELDKLYARYSF